MKRFLSFFIICLILITCTVSCKSQQVETEETNLGPQVSQMKSICELAVMDCYYHNVAKYFEEDAESFLWWTKDKHFWIEYSGIVTFGVDVSQVEIDVKDSQVIISLPKAKVLECKADSSSLTEESYIMAQDSAAIEAEDEIAALAEAQKQLEKIASSDTMLLTEAQQRVQRLLEDYIINVGKVVGKEYNIKWILEDTKSLETSNSLESIDSDSSEVSQKIEEYQE